MTTKDTKMSAQTDEHATETSSGKAELRVILRRNALMLFTLCGVIVGFALGFGVRPYGLSETGLMWLGNYLSRDMTKPTMWLCAQRRLRSAWAFAQSDQSLRCALSG